MHYLRSLFLRTSNMMKKRNVSLIAVLAMLTACSSTVDHHGKTPLVEVDGNFLYKEDVKSGMPVGLSSKDSAAFVEKYIRNWVEDALLYEKAESNVTDGERIDELVRNYRKSLIMHSYQQSLIEQELTGELSEEEMRSFYDANKMLFQVDETLLKGLFIKVPSGASGINRIRRWYKLKDAESIDRLEKYSLSNAVDYMYFYDRWIPASVLLAKLPLKIKDAEQYFRQNRHVELKDSAYYYFLHVDDMLLRGQEMPFEAAHDEVKKVLGNLKQADFMRQVRTDMYRRAEEKNEIKYYYNKKQ